MSGAMDERYGARGDLATRVAEWYAAYNRQYWANRLPPVTVVIEATDRPGSAVPGGYDPASRTLVLSVPSEVAEVNLRQALIHEMCHAALPEEPGHGAPFRGELQRLAEAGNEDAEVEVWMMVVDDIWDDGWVGEESGRWERYR